MSSFNWRDYFVLAKNLLGRSDEASLRSAVSRAYYAAFCTARNYAILKGFQSMATGKDHQLVEQFYSGQKSAKTIATNLGRLRISRNQCDYDDAVNNLQSIVNLSMLQAKAILQAIP